MHWYNKLKEYYGKDGSRIDILIGAASLAANTANEGVAYIIDINQRKSLENDLNHLFNSIPDILCLLDFDGKFLRMNKAGCELMGYKEVDVLYHSLEEFVHPQDKGIFTNEVVQMKKEGTPFKFENRYITKTGEIIWLSWYCNAIVAEGIIYATAKNITEEKKLKEAVWKRKSFAWFYFL